MSTQRLAGFVTLDSDGLHLPDGYGDKGGLVVRTPTATIDIRGFDFVDDDAGVIPVVKPRHWEVDPDDDRVRNPDAVGGRVGLKKYGAPIEWYGIKFEDQDRDPELDHDRGGEN